MRALAKLGTLPVALTVLTAITALYCGLVAFGNITDFGTNQAFVDHVFEMDTTFNDPDVMWRKITNNGVANAAYIGVIIWECLITAVLVSALVYWLKGDHRMGRRLSTLGWIMVFILFFAGFIAVGGEWFSMWQSSTWNGLEPAFRNVMVAGVGLILANLHGERRDAPEVHGMVDLDEDRRL